MLLLATPDSANSWTVREMMKALEWDMAAVDIYSEQDAYDAFSFFETSGALLGMATVMQVNCMLYRRDRLFTKEVTMNSIPSTDALIQAFINYSKNNPSKWDMRFETAAVPALSSNWPCQK